jgi:hypothetical protein
MRLSGYCVEWTEPGSNRLPKDFQANNNPHRKEPKPYLHRTLREIRPDCKPVWKFAEMCKKPRKFRFLRKKRGRAAEEADIALKEAGGRQ